MTDYRRNFVPDGTYFFTVCLADPQGDLLTRHVDLLRHCVRLCQKRIPFVINDAVILPSQIHMIWTLPAGDADFPKRWKFIKTTFSRHLPAPERQGLPAQTRGEKGTWQRGFWEHRIRDQDDYDLHAHLIATAPIKAGLSRNRKEWPLCAAYQRRMRFNASSARVKTTAPVP